MRSGTIARISRSWRRRFADGKLNLQVAAAALVCVVVVLIGAVAVWEARRAALEEAHATARNLAALLHEQTTMAMKSADLALLAVRERLENEDFPQNDPDFRAYLRMLDNHLEHVRALYVIGSDGFIVHDTDYPSTPRVSLADRGYFEALRDNPADSIFVGKPLLSRSIGRWFVPIARRFEHQDGSFAGVVAAAVEPQFFEHIYSQLQLSEFDSIALFHPDSTLIARVPPRPDLYGQRLAKLRLFTALLPQSSTDVYRVHNALMDRSSIIGYAKLADFPLIVTAAVDTRGALSNWRRQTWAIGLACLTILALTLLMHVTAAKRRLEQRVVQQKMAMREKLEAIGYMTSSVAHDFRNLLAAVLAGVRLLRRRGMEEKVLIAIEEAVDRGTILTTDLLQFARDQNVDTLIFDPNTRIQNLSTLLRQTIGSKVSLHLDLAPEVESVEASPALFDSSLINLAMNSSQAMPEGGELRIATAKSSVGEDPILPAGNYVVIWIEDTGHGISPDKLGSVFEPFVTFRGHEGTGLGLFQVRRFATDFGGDVRITSEMEKGTRVEILLPAVHSAEPTLAPASMMHSSDP